MTRVLVASAPTAVLERTISEATAAGLEVVAIWAPAGSPVPPEVTALASRHSLRICADDEIAGVRGVLVPASGPESVRAVERAAEHGRPMLAAPGTLEAARLPSDAVALPALPLLHHPAATRALTAVRGAEIGLLRAVAIDLVGVAPVPDSGLELAQGVGLLRLFAGPGRVRLQAHSCGAPAQAWTLVGQTEREIVVSLHTSAAAGVNQSHLLATVRLVGSHGSVTADLTGPALQLRSASHSRAVPYGPSAATLMLRSVGRVFSGEAAPQRGAWPGLLSALGVIKQSSAEGRAIEEAW